MLVRPRVSRRGCSLLLRAVRLPPHRRQFHQQHSPLDFSAVPDHYAVLGVQRDCELATIRSAYTRLVRQLHPDTASLTAALEDAASGTEMGPEPEAEPQARTPSFVAVVEAYGVLSDDAQRRQYDELLSLANSQWLDKALRKAASADSMNFRRRTRRSSSLELLQTDGAATVLRCDTSAVDAETWDQVLGTCAQFAHVKMALEIYGITQDYGVVLGAGAYNALFRLLIQFKDVENARVVWADMEEYGIEPDLPNANA
jgi:pentatricopeptide repeat protein